MKLFDEEKGPGSLHDLAEIFVVLFVGVDVGGVFEVRLSGGADAHHVGANPGAGPCRRPQQILVRMTTLMHCLKKPIIPLTSIIVLCQKEGSGDL